MKKAFTLLEMVFVIVAIGILAATIIPRVNTNQLGEAGHQLVSHIRYTQHLAMNNDKYDSSDDNWYRNKWQIIFEKTTLGSGGEHSYTIFSDFSGDSTGNADSDEIAVNPLDKSKRLTGGTDGFSYNEPEATQSMNLGKRYGVKDIKVTGGTSINSKRIVFDHLGRPYKITNMLSPIHGVATSPIYVKMCTQSCSGANNIATSENEIVVKVNHETGYACVLDSAGNCKGM